MLVKTTAGKFVRTGAVTFVRTGAATFVRTGAATFVRTGAEIFARLGAGTFVKIGAGTLVNICAGRFVKTTPATFVMTMVIGGCAVIEVDEAYGGIWILISPACRQPAADNKTISGTRAARHLGGGNDLTSAGKNCLPPEPVR